MVIPYNNKKIRQKLPDQDETNMKMNVKSTDIELKSF